MIKQVLAGAAFATAATMAVAAPASATTGPQPHKTPANALQSVLATPLAQGSTTSGTGCGCVGGTVSGITGSGTTGNLAGTTGGLTGNGTTGNLTGTVTGTTSNLTGNGTTAPGTGTTGNLAGTTGNLTSNPTGTVSSAASNPTGTVSNLTGTTGNLTGGLTGATSNLTGTTVPGADTTGTGAGASGTGAGASGTGATDFATRNGDTVITGEDGDGAGGILNTYGASLVNVDGRCLVPLPEGEGIGGHGLGGPKSACNLAPVDQYQGPQKLL